MPFIQGRDNLCDITHFKSIGKNDPHSKGLVSMLYSHLNALPDTKTPSYVEKWENDLGFHMDSSKWDKVWANTKISSHNLVALEANYKVLIRWYLVPVRIAKYVPQYSPLCFRGCGDLGTYFHIFWDCHIAKNYWK